MKPCIIMRSHNDMPLIAETLARVAQQDRAHELVVFDNDSTDGTVEEVSRYTDQIVHVPSGTYVPGRVLNQALATAHGEFVVFLNSDCTPQSSSWLRELLAGFSHDDVGAVFGRQIPRPDCQLLYAKDTEDTYGAEQRHHTWKHCFSMASSAIRRSLWQCMPFDEHLQYSEDIDWTWRVRQRGYSIHYVPTSVVMHSHNYTWRQYYARQYGEGKAEAVIFPWTVWQRSLIRYSLLPYSRQVMRDWHYCISRGALGTALYVPLFRLAHLFGRRAGFRAGWRSVRAKPRPPE